MNQLFKLYKLLNILNLDVAVGAAGMAIFISKIFDLEVPWGYYYLMFSVVWTIYLLDHLYDSKKSEAISDRRIFFKKFHHLFRWILLINLIGTATFFIFNFNILFLLYATPSVGITGVYILANWLFQENKQRFYLKEFLIALGFSFGVMVIPISFRKIFDWEFVMLIGLIFFMALWNLLMIARFEKDIDMKEGQTSMSQWVSLNKIKWLNYFFYSCFLTLGIIYGCLYCNRIMEVIIFGLITIYMLIPFIWPSYFKKGERYHRYVDMVFLISFVGLLPG